MKYCEQCRVKAEFPRNNGYPYVGYGNGKCEICRKHGLVHDVDKRQIVKTGSKDEKTVDTMHQIMYRNLAEELAIYHESGPKSGQINETLTSQLKQIKLEIDGQVNWKTTYELRLSAKNAAQSEALKRKSRGE